MKSDEGIARPVAVVIGSGEVGSAIAVVLHRAGFAAVVCDEVDPAWPRRGMASELDREAAVFCASLKSIPAVLDRRRLIAATTWSWRGVASAVDAVAIVDATLDLERAPLATRGPEHDEPIKVLVGPPACASAAVDATVHVNLAPSDDERLVVVRAQRSGRFATARRIGDRVFKGDVVGAIGTLAVAAPRDGALRGLTARGARVREGQEVVEVDPRGDPVRCYGLSEAAVAAGREVLGALADHGVVPGRSVAGAAREILAST